jgi:methanesulfonate monooxygenase small subunit
MDTTDAQIHALIYRSCLFMNEENFAGFIDLCTPDFHYSITVHSPELRRGMTWLHLERDEMRQMLDNLPQHVRVSGQLTRQLVVYLVEREEGALYARVTGGLSVFETDTAGVSKLLAVGTYLDGVSLAQHVPLLQSREVRLITRQLGVGSHIPL